jgi:hypothetical protein
MGGMTEEDTALVPNDQVIKNALLSLSSEDLEKLIICKQNKLSTNAEEMYKPTIDNKILEIAESILSPISSPILPPSNGLIIHNAAIQKLSGPISFYYLKPDYSRIAKEDIEKYPLIMLLGDYHMSFDNICDPCDISNGCYRIDSPEFLQVIDSLAMMELPSVSIDEPSAAIKSDFYIDWFVENSFYGMGDGFKNGPMDYFTNFSRPDNISACYDRSLIGTPEYLEKCPTKNIRWHHGDLRLFGDIYIIIKINQYILKLNIILQKISHLK